MESVQFLTAEKLKARAAYQELAIKRKAKEEELNGFRKNNHQVIEEFHKLIYELEDATRALVKHPHL